MERPTDVYGHLRDIQHESGQARSVFAVQHSNVDNNQDRLQSMLSSENKDELLAGEHSSTTSALCFDRRTAGTRIKQSARGTKSLEEKKIKNYLQ